MIEIKVGRGEGGRRGGEGPGGAGAERQLRVGEERGRASI